MYDVIIIGAGSAGCALANRLSADPQRKVLLLEAGPPDSSPWVHVPAGVLKLFSNPKSTWCEFTEEEPGLSKRKVYLPRGRILGGSSAINGMAYVRGQPADYDTWRDRGNPGWGYEDVLPLFRRGERWQRGETRFHGGSGEMGVSDPTVRHPGSQAFIDAAVSMGYPLLDDYNGDRQEGVSWLQYSIWNGRRSTAARAFLSPARARPNLTIRTGCTVQRIVVQGRRATGVVVRTDTAGTQTLQATEIVVSAGAMHSPKLLMLSGIGPAQHLGSLGIDVVQDLPGVGENLHDHLYVNLRYEVEPHLSMNSATKFPGYFPHALQYLLTRRGLLAMATTHCVAFTRSSDTVAHPDIQLMFRPYAFSIQGSKFVPDPMPSITASACFVRPHSRGAVRLRSADPAAPVRATVNYLTDPRDLSIVVTALRNLREILAAPAFKSHLRGPGEMSPGLQAQSDAELEAHCRSTGQSVYHPVGTCQMGPDPATGAVVDASLRVHGIEALRVCDASIMPSICSGNTNAASIMIGEKGADLIGGA